jgi:hypothetical protein
MDTDAGWYTPTLTISAGTCGGGTSAPCPATLFLVLLFHDYLSFERIARSSINADAAERKILQSAQVVGRRPVFVYGRAKRFACVRGRPGPGSPVDISSGKRLRDQSGHRGLRPPLHRGTKTTGIRIPVAVKTNGGRIVAIVLWWKMLFFRGDPRKLRSSVSSNSTGTPKALRIGFFAPSETRDGWHLLYFFFVPTTAPCEGSSIGPEEFQK